MESIVKKIDISTNMYPDTFALVHDTAAREYHGEYAYVNFK